MPTALAREETRESARWAAQSGQLKHATLEFLAGPSPCNRLSGNIKLIDSGFAGSDSTFKVNSEMCQFEKSGTRKPQPGTGNIFFGAKAVACCATDTG
jgi:hypothetical protein